MDNSTLKLGFLEAGALLQQLFPDFGVKMHYLNMASRSDPGEENINQRFLDLVDLIYKTACNLPLRADIKARIDIERNLWMKMPQDVFRRVLKAVFNNTQIPGVVSTVYMTILDTNMPFALEITSLVALRDEATDEELRSTLNDQLSRKIAEQEQSVSIAVDDLLRIINEDW